MVFGINKKYFTFLLNPYLFYLHYKRNRLINKYKHKSILLGLDVSINKSVIGNHVYLGSNVKLNNSVIDSHSYVHNNTRISNSKIGKFCSIGPDVKLGMGIHPTHLISTHPAFYSNNKAFKTFSDKTYFKEYKEIIIGNDVWIGGDVTIMGGIKIGDGAIIAAGAIVTKDINPYEVVGGVPAKHIKYRFDEDKINRIRKSVWWDKDEQWFEDNYMVFLDEEKFLDYFDNYDQKIND